MDLNQTRNRLVSFFEEFARLRYKQDLGVSGETLRDINSRYSDLFNEKLVKNYKSLFESESDEDRKRSYKNISAIITDGYLSTLHTGEEQHKALQRIGYQGFLEYYSIVFSLDYEELKNIARELLNKTSDQYAALLDECLQGKATGSTNNDLDIVIKLTRFDVFFPCLSDGSALKALKGFFNKIDLSVDAIRGLKINPVSSSGRKALPFYSMIKPKEECYITIFENSSAASFRSLTHELGHAFHMDSSDDSLPIEWIRTQDKATAEGFANMFTAICCEKKWIEEYVAPEIPDDFDQHIRLWLLHKIRLFAIQFLNEVVQFNNSSLALRSWLMATSFIESLRLSYGDDWWTGFADMKNEWKDGNKWTAEEYYKKDRKTVDAVVEPLLNFLRR